MSFTEGNVSQFNTGDVVDALEDKVGSFIIFVWPDDSSGPSATFAISKNDSCVDWKRLSCVKDNNGVFLVPSVDGTHLSMGLSDPNNTDYSSFYVKILG